MNSVIIILFSSLILLMFVISYLKGMSKNNITIIGGENQNEVSNNINIDTDENLNVIMVVEDVFTITGRGTVVTGKIIGDKLEIGDSIRIQNKDGIKSIPAVVGGIEMFRKSLTVAYTNDNVGVLINNINRNDVAVDDFIVKM